MPQNTVNLTMKQAYRKALSSNATTTSYAAIAPTVTEPANAIDATGSQAQLVFFGTDADDEAFNARIIMWSHIGGLWIPTPLLEVTATLGTGVGVAGQSVTDNDMFADTIAIANEGKYSSTYQIINAQNNLVASLLIDHRGAQKIEVQIDRDTAASGNALIRFY